MNDLRRILDEAHAAIDTGKYGQARVLLQRALRLAPDDAETNDAMRALLAAQRQWAQALPYARRAAEAAPDHTGVITSLAVVLGEVGDYAGAVRCARRLVELDPENLASHTALVSMLLKAGMLIDCEEAGLRALERWPTSEEIMFPLAAALLEQGRAERCAQLLSRFLFQETSDIRLAGFLCTVSNYMWPTSRAMVAARHRNFGRIVRLMDHAVPRPIDHTPQRRPDGTWAGRGRDGRLRVAIMSCDLRRHSVSFFAEPIIDRLDRTRFHLVVYNTAPVEDAVTARLRARVVRDGGEHAWRRIAHLSAEQAAAQIAADRVDILIDLVGLTAGERCDILRLKPAPVQVTAIGYPNTTGLATVDWRIVDSITDPPPPVGVDDAVERLARLDPCFLCYRPPSEAPAPVPLDPGFVAAEAASVQRGEGLVFGSFNALMKLTDAAVSLWAGVLRELPGSSLLLKAASLRDGRVGEATRARFAEVGIDPARVRTAEFLPTMAEHLATYSGVHVALDTFPYHGTTTTCEALLMGVPVVSLAPPPPEGVHAMRVGASLLTAVGLPDLAAPDPETFVRVAVDLARDRARLATLRGPGPGSLRARLEASPLRDEDGYARRLGDLLERFWADWCERRSAAAGSSA